MYVSLPVPCTPIISNCQIPSIGTIYGWPEISLHITNSPIIASFKFSITSPFPNHSFSSGHITSNPISIPKPQFQLRPHHIQSHLHSHTTGSTQATLHPVPSPFPNHSFSSGHITSRPTSFPKLQFQLRPNHIQSDFHSQTTVTAKAT